MDITRRIERHNGLITVNDYLVLDHLQREKGRFKTTSTQGYEIRIFLERGKILQENELLQTNCGHTLQVKYAAESVMTATTQSWLSLSQGSYHLGNRHVRLQIGKLWLRFKPDHVLQKLVESYGFKVKRHNAIFIPTPGAYSHHANHAHLQTH